MNICNDEKKFQQLIEDTPEIQHNILDALDIQGYDCIFEREVEFINGITSDFIVYDTDNTMQAILECKKANIGVNDYVRGIGQLLQYEYFQENDINPRKHSDINYVQSLNKNVLVLPSEFITQTSFNIGKFKYPVYSKILEIHISNKNVREITQSELDNLSAAADGSLVTICQYYFRDVRIFECYILLQVLNILSGFDIKLNRSEVEKQLLRKFSVINNNNWRNAFIALSNLGFIGNNNNVMSQAFNYVNKSWSAFINDIYVEYYYPFVDLLMDILVDNAIDGKVEITNKQIANCVRKKFGNRDVLYVTDSNERYISSWLNMLRDDLGCIDFKARTNLRYIKYIPKELNNSERQKKIEHHSNAERYVYEFINLKSEAIKDFL